MTLIGEFTQTIDTANCLPLTAYHRQAGRFAVSLVLFLLAGCQKQAASPVAVSPSAIPSAPSASTSDSARPVLPRFTREVPWAGAGAWIKADTHIHTRFSDGSYAPADVAAKAIEN